MPADWKLLDTALRADWRDGIVASAIAARLTSLGCGGVVTRCAVISRAHRLGLDGRPSPLRPSREPGQPTAERRRRAPGVSTLPPLMLPEFLPAADAFPIEPPAAPSAPRPEAEPLACATPADIAKLQAASASAPVPAPPGTPFCTPPDAANPSPPPPRQRRVVACSWLYGDRGHYRQCETPAQEGKPYCLEHHARAYVSRRGVALSHAESGFLPARQHVA